MAVLIDRPLWWHRGRRWSHLVSDSHLDELHRFAAAAGIPERGFHDDHYDVPEEWFEAMVAQGAELVSSRDMVRRMRAAGLRRRRGHHAHEPTADDEPSIEPAPHPPSGPAAGSVTEHG